MMQLTINHRTIEVTPGTTVWQAARDAGIEIPVMCFTEGSEHFTSCMVCLVKDMKTGRLFASCSTPVAEGMELLTNDEETIESRKMALELLLSEHVGDCEAPCQLVCPAHMNIPLMNRLIAKGDFSKALEVVKRDIALPAVLGSVCPAPCEAGCRRKQVDEAISICLLKKFVGVEDLSQEHPWQPEKASPTGKSVAIIGAGPAGLSAAYYLQRKGHQSVIYDLKAKAGGELLEIDRDTLDPELLEKEIQTILQLGVEIHLNSFIDEQLFHRLQQQYDAIVLAIGSNSADNNPFNLPKTAAGIPVGKGSYLTSLPGVFAIGNALRHSRLAVRSVGQGKEVAAVIDQFLATGGVQPYPERFNSKFGKLAEDEFVHYLNDSVSAPRQKGGERGFDGKTAQIEAGRCMHCDCRNPESCRLRELSDQFGASQKRFKGEERKPVERLIHREGIVYESNKCIKCGICVRLTRQHGEKFGFTFIGRGFDVKVGIPFDETLQKGLEKTAAIVAKGCPTGALALFGEEEQK